MGDQADRGAEIAAANQPILIVGGGLGGLTAALALARRGWPVRVLEGAPEFGAIGYGIQFGPNVFHVLNRIGVGEEILEWADSPSSVVMLDALTGAEVTRVSTGAAFRRRFKYPYIIIHRIDLHQLLLKACRRRNEIGPGAHRRRQRALAYSFPAHRRRRTAAKRIRRASHHRADGRRQGRGPA